MPEFEVIVLPLAEEDIYNCVDYIFFDKESPETALNLLDGFRETISKLEFMPTKHEYDEDEELARLKIRKCYFKNYKLYFYVDEVVRKVFILRVFHMLVNSKPILLKMFY